MMKSKNQWGIIFLNFVLFFLVCCVYASGTISLQIGNAVPFTVLSLVAAYSLFATPQKSAVIGLIVGIFLDSTAGDTYCFNAIIIMLIAVFVNLSANNLFNKNLRATFVISLLSAIAYYLFYWICFFIYGYTLKDSLNYLIGTGFPSAIYTSFFIFPFYFCFKFFEKLR